MNKQVPETKILKIIASDLVSQFTDEQIDAALIRTMRECDWPSLKTITERVPGVGNNDGRPGAEAAWSMCPKTEDASVVWTEEMQTAFGAARPLLADGDLIAARMAFREVYASELAKAREQRRPVKWTASLGWDKSDRVRALSEAVAAGKLSAENSLSLVSGEQQEELQQALPAPERHRLLLVGTSSPVNKAALSALQKTLVVLKEQKQIDPALLEAKEIVRAPEKTPEERAEHAKRVREQARQLMQRKQTSVAAKTEVRA